jgi:hypothetical protein
MKLCKELGLAQYEVRHRRIFWGSSISGVQLMPKNEHGVLKTP